MLQQSCNRATPELQQRKPLGPVSAMPCCKKSCNRATGPVNAMPGFLDSGGAIFFGASGGEGRSVWGDMLGLRAWLRYSRQRRRDAQGTGDEGTGD